MPMLRPGPVPRRNSDVEIRMDSVPEGASQGKMSVNPHATPCESSEGNDPGWRSS